MLMSYYVAFNKFLYFILFFVSGSDHVSSLVAFLLALFCILVQQVQERFLDSVLNLSLPPVEEPNINLPKVNGNGSDTIENSVNNMTKSVKENGHHDCANGNELIGQAVEAIDKKPKRRKRVVRRRQRQCDSSNESGESNGTSYLYYGLCTQISTSLLQNNSNSEFFEIFLLQMRNLISALPHLISVKMRKLY